MIDTEYCPGLQSSTSVYKVKIKNSFCAKDKNMMKIIQLYFK